MDNKKEQSEKFIKSEISSTTPVNTETANTSTNLSTCNDNDTISTDSSELLSSWTLVNDKENNKLKDESDDHIEILKHSSENEEDAEEEVEEENPDESLHVNLDGDTDKDTDDYFEEEGEAKFNYLNNFPYGDIRLPVTIGRQSFEDGFAHKKRTNAESQSPCIHEHSSEVCPPFLCEPENVYEPLVPDQTFNHALKEATHSMIKFSYSMTKRGLSCALYVGIGVALLAFLGHVFNTSWQPFSAVVNNVPSTKKLQQQIDDLELHNNLLRAEIDLLTKEVKYLSALFNEPQHREKSVKFREHKSGKYFKAWPGNGDSLKPVDITKQDLKTPYKCPDGSFVEIANMCVEQKLNSDPPIVDQFGQVVENLKELSDAFTAFEQVAEELHAFQDNASEDPNLYASQKHHKNEDKNSNNGNKKFTGKDNSHEWKKSKSGRRSSSEIHDDADDNVEWQEKRMRGREQLRKKNKSDEDDDDDDSGEWHSNYMKHREQQRKRNEYKSGSHEWHDNYMKNRDQQRKQYNKNVHNRETKRSSGEKYR